MHFASHCSISNLMRKQTWPMMIPWLSLQLIASMGFCSGQIEVDNFAMFYRVTVTAFESVWPSCYHRNIHYIRLNAIVTDCNLKFVVLLTER